MASIYDKASLVLIPSGSKTSKVYSQVPTNGDGDFTFSRSTAATRVNASGNIEKETQNLLLQSNTFDTTWTNTSGATTSGQTGYDGSNDAWLITKTAAWAHLRQDITSSGVQTFSVYAKENASNWIGIVASTSGTDPLVYIDLANETIGTQVSLIDATITDVGNDWKRVTMTFNASITRIRIYAAEANTASGTSGSIYIQDAQLEQGLVARDYIETTTTAIYGGITDNVPRLDYQGSCPALLLEPQRTNLLPHSEYFGDWNLSGASIAIGSLNSPTGDSNAYVLTQSTTGYGSVYKILATTSGTIYTASVFAKAGTSNYLGLELRGSVGIDATFDLSNGTLSSGSGVIEDYGNGWYRCSITKTINSSSALFLIGRGGAGATGDTTNLFGAQLEAGSYATSYIPTYGSAVTRNADRNETTPNTLISSQVFSMFFEYTPTGGGTSGSTPAFELNIQGTSNNVSFYVNNSGANDGLNIYLGPTNGGYLWGTATNNGWTLNQKSKVALTYDGDNLRYFINGVLHRSQTGVSFTNATTALYILHAKGNEVEQALVFPTALTDQEAIDLTTL